MEKEKRIEALLGTDVEIWTHFCECEGTLRKDEIGYYLIASAKIRFKDSEIKQISPHEKHPIILLQKKGE